MRKIFQVSIIILLVITAGCNRTTESVVQTGEPVNFVSGHWEITDIDITWVA